MFDDIVSDMLSNKKLNTVVTELFIRGRKLNIPLVFITLSYFAVPKNIRLNSTHYFIMKILNKREFQQIAFNHSSDIDFKDFMNLYKKYFAKLYIFLVIDATLASDEKIRDEKLQCDIDRKAAKMSTLLSEKIDKYEYLTGD